jgi:hypothetical protein
VHRGTVVGDNATVVAEIATWARVSVDTVYVTVGRKPLLLREFVETAISGTELAVPDEQRDDVARIRLATQPATRSPSRHPRSPVLQRVALAFLALQTPQPPTRSALRPWAEVAQGCANKIGTVATDPRTTGEAHRPHRRPARTDHLEHERPLTPRGPHPRRRLDPSPLRSLAHRRLDPTPARLGSPSQSPADHR